MHHRQPVAKEVVFFLAEVPSTAVRLSDEHQDYRWGEPEQLLPLLKRDVQRGLLLRAIAHLEAAEARSPGRGEEGER